MSVALNVMNMTEIARWSSSFYTTGLDMLIIDY